MNFKSLFNKNNYNYLFNLIKPYNGSVKDIPTDISELSDLTSLLNYFEIDKYKKIVVVASGPSSNKMKLEDDALYLCTNRSIQLVKEKNFIYIVYDPYFLTLYLKSFPEYPFWKGTFFWICNNNTKINSISFEKALKYLHKKSRTKKEILITDFQYNINSKNLDLLLKSYIEDVFNFKYYSINSGFTSVLLGCVLAHLNKMPIEIYGLDMGEGGNAYFDREAPIGKSIKGENNRLIVKQFFMKSYQSNLKITNYSNFMNYECNK